MSGRTARVTAARDAKAARIAKMVRVQIADAIRDDLKGSERLMKEVFENLPGETTAEYDESIRMCNREMRRVISWLVRGEA